MLLVSSHFHVDQTCLPYKKSYTDVYTEADICNGVAPSFSHKPCKLTTGFLLLLLLLHWIGLDRRVADTGLGWI